MQATWLGHASCLVQMEGVNFLTDPVFSQRCSPVQWKGPRWAHPCSSPPCVFKLLPSVLQIFTQGRSRCNARTWSPLTAYHNTAHTGKGIIRSIILQHPCKVSWHGLINDDQVRSVHQLCAGCCFELQDLHVLLMAYEQVLTYITPEHQSLFWQCLSLHVAASSSLAVASNCCHVKRAFCSNELLCCTFADISTLSSSRSQLVPYLLRCAKVSTVVHVLHI